MISPSASSTLRRSGRSLALAIVLGLTGSVSAQEYSVLCRLMRTNGAGPYGGVALVGSALYGTASGGGADNSGVVFKVNTNGNGYTVLQSFWPNGARNPSGTVIESEGVLYGTTWGAVYRVDASGANFQVLVYGNQIGSSVAQGELVLEGQTLYGTTWGGSSTDGGAVYAVGTDGSDLRVLKRFSGTEFTGPQSGLLLHDGILYGTTSGGGASKRGTVFSVQTNGTYTLLKSFDGGAEGATPYAPLALAGNFLCGTTTGGGTGDHGTVFKLSLDGTGFRVLKHFEGTDGKYPVGRLFFSGGRLYGTAAYGGVGWDGNCSGSGTVFQLTPEGEDFSVLTYFNGENGANPRGSFTAFSNLLYGTTSAGGVTQAGVVFSLAIPVSPVIERPPTTQSAAAGLAATFAVETLGSLPLSFQWYFNGSNALFGATNKTLRVGPLQEQHAGLYTVVITNAFGSITSAPAALTVIPQTRYVTEPTESAFLSATSGGGIVRFVFDAVISLTGTFTNSTDLLLDGSGHDVTLSGGGTQRVVLVRSNTTFAARGLTIAHGWAPNGAGLLNDGGTVRLERVTFQSNIANAEADFPYSAQLPEGGGLLNERGAVFLTNCRFLRNLVQQTNQGSAGFSQSRGGALATHGGQVRIEGGSFVENVVLGSCQSTVHEACGGAVYSEGLLRIGACAFSRNAAVGSAADYSSGGHGKGGALYNAGELDMRGCLLENNSAVGGRGTPGSDGIAMILEGVPGDPGGPGGSAYGGALYSAGSASFINVTVVSNRSAGGLGGAGGRGGDAFAPADKPSFGGDGGNGGPGGSGFGGFYTESGECVLTHCTVAFNEGIAGDGGAGGEGGFGTYRGGRPGTAGSAGSVGGGMNGVSSMLLNTLLATNLPVNSSTAGLVDSGGNLSSDLSCAFTNSSSRNGVDLLIGVPADNGGPTATLSLLSGSPAIDAGVPAGLFVDQRSYPRPAGIRSDVGALELNSALPDLAVLRLELGLLRMTGFGNAGQPCRLLRSADLSSWSLVASDRFSETGAVAFAEPLDATANGPVFYRLVMP